MTVRFSGPYDPYFKPDGPFDVFLREAVNRGRFVEKSGSEGSLTIKDTSGVPVAGLQAFIGAGLEIEWFEVFVIVPAAGMIDNVPVEVSNASYVRYEEDGTETVVNRSWSVWHDDSHSHEKLSDGTFAVSTASYGRAILGSELKFIFDTGLEVITKDDFKDDSRRISGEIE
jgi:hypothetical protein